MKFLDKHAMAEQAIKQIRKPCLYIRIDWVDEVVWTNVLANAPYLATCEGFIGDEFGLVVCDTMEEAETLFAQTVCDNLKGGVYALLYNAEGEAEDENT